MTEVGDLDFPQTPEQAAERFGLYRQNDPFPDVQAALLNSADIYDYARVTGMIWPFHANEQSLTKKLKPASFEVDFSGDVHYCDSIGNYQVKRITSDTEFKLQKNSIAFVYLDTWFRLPDYIALRFNLKITHVHAGLLLGTGPLVDPGFDGRLLIPLHNLTAEDYTLTGGQGLIWVEFTKLSRNPRWDQGFVRPPGMYGEYRPFPKAKDGLTAQDFFLKAGKCYAPASSIPNEIREATNRATQAAEAANLAKASAEHAKGEANRVKTLVTWAGTSSIIALVVSLSFGLYQVVSLVADATQYVKGAKDEVKRIHAASQKRQDEMDSALETINSRLTTIENLNKNNLKNPTMQDHQVSKPFVPKQ